MFNTRSPKPEHIKAFLSSIKRGETTTPYEIVKRSNLSLTAVQGVISKLESEGKIELIRQTKTPRLQVTLK